jgi:hypothetical protein
MYLLRIDETATVYAEDQGERVLELFEAAAEANDGKSVVALIRIPDEKFWITGLTFKLDVSDESPQPDHSINVKEFHITDP